MRIFDIIKMYEKRSKKDASKSLLTPWGEKINSMQPLLTYPRPNLVRDSYFCLNGFWDYCIQKDAFLENDDLCIPDSFQEKIVVPFSPESILSGVMETVYPNDALWYHKSFLLDSISDKLRLILHFGAVDQICTLYVNGERVASHVGGYLPFSVDITSFIHDGVNDLHLLVRDFTDSSYHSRGKQKLKNGGMFYQCQSGIWQTVWYEFVPNSFVQKFTIHTDFDQQQVSFSPKLSIVHEKNDQLIHKSKDQTMKVTISFQGNTIYQNDFLPFEEKIKIKDFYPWTPETPHLYDVEVTIGEDIFRSYFAFRHIEIVKDPDPQKDNQNIIHLNHKPYFMNGVLDQGYWPDGLYTPASYEAYEFDILEMKKLGFNMIRKHIKIEPLIFYHLCDKLGMLIWQDMVNGGTDYQLSVALSVPMGAILSSHHMSDHHYKFTARHSLDGRVEWLKECRDTVHLLSFFPSIVCWVPFNEGWGQFDAVKVANLIRRLDPTRLIDHASGWFDQGAGNIKSEHNYFKKLKVRSDPSRAYVLSEFGGIVYRVEDHSYRNHTFGYQTCLSLAEYNERYQKLMAEVEQLKQNGMSGCVYTQLSDVEEEMNGILTYDRKVNKLKQGM